MDIKYCPECSGANMRNAIYCMDCRHQFPEFSTTAKATAATRTVPKSVRKVVAVEVDTDLELPEDLREGIQAPDGELANIFLDIITQKGLLKAPPGGIKFEDAIAAKAEPRTGRRTPETTPPKNAKQAKAQAQSILRSTANRKNVAN